MKETYKSTRIKGLTLQFVYQLTRIPWLARLMYWGIKKKFAFNKAIQLLPTDSELETEPHPIPSGKPRNWGHAQLGGLPSVKGSISELHNAYVNGDVDPTEVIEKLLDRIEKNDFGEATFSPFSAIDHQRIRQEALSSKARYDNGKPLGVIDGIPIPIKDNLNVAGLPTKVGTSYLNRIENADAYIVEQLCNAGAIITGKTHTTEWLMNGWGMNHHFDMPRNVWNAAYGAGGSSTGSAVSVALGLSPVAVGSDGGGSIRMPAALNGIFGLKPTYTRASRTGDKLKACTFNHNGPMGRCTEDLIHLLASMSLSKDPNDSLTHIANDLDHAYDSWLDSLGRGIKGCKIGVLQPEMKQTSPTIRKACQGVLDTLEKEGAELINIEIPLSKYSSAICGFNITFEVLAGLDHDRKEHRKNLGLELQILLNTVSKMSLHDYTLVQKARTELRKQVKLALEKVDVLMLPTLQGPPIPYGLDEGRIDIGDPDANGYMTQLTVMSNITGLPAGTVPIGMHNGFPVNMQIIADAWDEASVFAVMAHLERIGIAKTNECEAFKSYLD